MMTPYQTTILLTVLHECETWSLTLREKHRVRVFENRVLRKTYGAKRDEITGEWRKLNNKELYDLYFMSDQSKKIRWAGHMARIGERRGAYRISVGRTGGNRPL